MQLQRVSDVITGQARHSRREGRNLDDGNKKREHGSNGNVTYPSKDKFREAEERLYNDLFSNYNGKLFPGAPTEVKVGLSYSCANYDENSHVLTSRGNLRLSWTDERLRWDPSRYGGINVLRMPPYRAWKPDIKLYNAFEAEQWDYDNILIYSNGEVHHIPAGSFKTFCSPNNDRSASCELKFGSWTYDGFILPLDIYRSPVDDESAFDTAGYFTECPYNITKQKAAVKSVYYPCCSEPYPHLLVQFDVKKNGRL